MRRFPFALLSCFMFLSLAGWSQKSARPLTDEGLRTAQAPHRYEPPSPSATYLELESRADDFRTEKAYADAVDYYRAALGRTRDKQAQASLYNKIGISELQMQHLREAKKNFERALKLRRDFVEARNNLGATFYMDRKYRKAIKEYTQALRIQENNASFHNNLASAYFMNKDTDLAMLEYSRAFQLDPTVFERSSHGGISAQLANPENRAQYSYMLARMYAKAGDLDRSILYLKKAMEDGYKDINNVYKDQEFTVLRSDHRFSELMAAKPAAIPE